MSWIVNNQNKNTFKKIKFDDFILISTPKCGSYFIEDILKKNDFLLSRPSAISLKEHITFLDVYHTISKSEYRDLRNYLIPIREPVSWRKSIYNFVKHKPQESGQYFASELFQSISFENYIEMLVDKDGIQIPTIDNLPFIPRGSYLTNRTLENKIIRNTNIYIYDMTEGLSNLFKNYFDIEINDKERNTSTSYSEDLVLSEELTERLNLFDDISKFNSEEYKVLT